MSSSFKLGLLICGMAALSHAATAGINWRDGTITDKEKKEITKLTLDGEFLISWKDDKHIPSQGWKIHVSANIQDHENNLTDQRHGNLDKIAEVVIPILHKKNIDYKIAEPSVLKNYQVSLEELKNKRPNEVASILNHEETSELPKLRQIFGDENEFNKIFQPGKFITIYPKSLKEVALLLKELDQQLMKITDKNIYHHLPGDMKVGKSGGLFTRYGAMVVGGNGKYERKGSSNNTHNINSATPVEEKEIDNIEERFIIAQGDSETVFYKNVGAGYDDRREYPFPAFIANTEKQKNRIFNIFKGLDVSWRDKKLEDIIKLMKDLNTSPATSEAGQHSKYSGDSRENSSSSGNLGQNDDHGDNPVRVRPKVPSLSINIKNIKKAAHANETRKQEDSNAEQVGQVKRYYIPYQATVKLAPMVVKKKDKGNSSQDMEGNMRKKYPAYFSPSFTKETPSHQKKPAQQDIRGSSESREQESQITDEELQEHSSNRSQDKFSQPIKSNPIGIRERIKDLKKEDPKRQNKPPLKERSSNQKSDNW